MNEETIQRVKEQFIQNVRLEKVEDVKYINDLCELDWRLEIIKSFLSEIKEVEMISEEGNEARIVSKDIWEDQVKNADFVSIELDGEFVKVAAISNFPCKTIYLIYIETTDII